jgi:hypothetical protein
VDAEYHLIDLATGLSHGGFRSLEAARKYARDEAMGAWDIFAEMCVLNTSYRSHLLGTRSEMGQLILKRAPIGWNQDDFDVLEDGIIVGRIFKVPIAPEDRPWMWASGHNRAMRRAAHGYELTRETAMQAFARSWHREKRLARPSSALAHLQLIP